MSETETTQGRFPGERRPILQSADDVFEIAVKLGLFFFLVYWSTVLLRPFLSIALWSLILAVALYPAFSWTARLLGGRRKLAAVLVTAISLLVFTGPIIWLGISMIEGVAELSRRLSAGDIAIPPPSEEIKHWPFIGEQLFHLWGLASTNLKSAITEALPYLSPFRSTARKMAESAATGIPTFLVSLIVAGALFPPAPSLLEGVRTVSRRILPARGQELVKLTGATIRNVAQGVVGVSFLQAILAGLGFLVAGIPGSGFLALGVLVTGILQIQGLFIIPVLLWVWTSMDTTTALALTAYLVPVGVLNNVLNPIIMAHGLRTPMLVIFIGLMGGALAHGIIGLFVGPIVLAVTWELAAAWIKHEETPVASE
ncbi:MAG: AI-2E family transporter [Rhodomicrobium sp.]